LYGHHGISGSVLQCQKGNLHEFTATIRSITYKFTDHGVGLFYLVTKSVIPEEVKDDLCRQTGIGRLFSTFASSDSIKHGEINLWAPMNKHD
jgi:hypothetical protein